MRPMCGKCGIEMTPQNARIHPELFLHDACLPTLEEVKAKLGDIPIADLPKYLQDRVCKGFKPIPTYSLIGDMLTIYLEDEPAFAEQINPQVTVERAFSDKRIVGVKIYGVAGMVARAEFEANLAEKANAPSSV